MEVESIAPCVSPTVTAGANNGRKAAILNLFKSNFFRMHSLLKSHILFYSNGLAIQHGLPDIRPVEVNNGQ